MKVKVYRSVERARLAYLDALEAFLRGGSVRTHDVIEAYKEMCQSRREKDLDDVVEFDRMWDELHRLECADKPAWARFFISSDMLMDGDTRHRFKSLSPFRGSSFVMEHLREDGSVGASETENYFSDGQPFHQGHVGHVEKFTVTRDDGSRHRLVVRYRRIPSESV